MKMPDSDKLALIDNMITDFWEYNTVEQRKNGAESFITSIATVINFDGKEKWKGEKEC